MWDELTCLRPFTSCTCGTCTCGATKAIVAIESEDRLIQFLIGLNESYEHIKSQILIMDPLPNVSKAIPWYKELKTENLTECDCRI